MPMALAQRLQNGLQVVCISRIRGDFRGQNVQGRAIRARRRSVVEPAFEAALAVGSEVEVALCSNGSRWTQR